MTGLSLGSIGLGLGRPRPQVRNQFSSMKAKLIAGTEDVVCFCNSDSTGNATTEVPYLFWSWLAEQYPAYTFRHVFWDETGGVSYNAPTTITTGTGAHTATLYNCAKAGGPINYPMDQRYAAAVAANAPYDAIFVNHGHNVSGSEVLKRGKFWAALEMLKQRNPNAGFVIVKQNPQQDDSNVVQSSVAEELAGLYGDNCIRVWDAFVAAGKPANYYADSIHPSSLAQSDVILPLWRSAWNISKPGVTPLHPAKLNTEVVNLLSLDANGVDQGYGHFQGYAGPSGAPPGWTITGSGLTVTKDTTIVDTELGDTYSVKLVGDGSVLGQRININVPAAVLTAIKANGFYTLAIRKYVPSGQSSNTGRCQVLGTGGTTYTTEAIGDEIVDSWVWEILAKMVIVQSQTTLQIRLQASSAAAAGTVYYGRAVLVAGDIPYGDQTAPSP